MQHGDGQSLSKSAFLLLPVLALAFYIGFIPHQSDSYPVHIDEWINLARFESLEKANTLAYPDIYSGEAPQELSSNMEFGFQTYWAVFQRITGIPWLIIFRYFPGIILMFTVLAAFILAHRLRFGLEAAFFTCLLPTTVGILGPAFLVPVALALPFVLLTLFIAFNFKSWWSYCVIFIFNCLLVTIHPPSAVCLLIIIVPYILMNLKKGSYWHCLGITLAILVPFIAPFPWIYNTVIDAAKSLLTKHYPSTFVDFPMIIKTYGYLPVALGLLGTLVLAIRRGKENYGLIFGLLTILAMLTVFFTFHYGLSILYERGLTFMMLMLGIVAGAGLAWVKNIGFNAWLAAKLRFGGLVRYAGWLICLGLVGVTLFISVPSHQQTPYYHMIDDEDYQAFVWIKDNLGPEYRRGVLDPWKAIPFAAVSGKVAYTYIHTAAKPSDEQAAEFLAQGCTDTAFLRANSITFVYTRGACQNPDLEPVREFVYLRKK
jgi:hypothetical protein